MSVPKTIRFTRKAEADFTSILLYTEQQWGEQQKETYANRLFAALERLAGFPELGETRDDLAPGLRALRVEQHVVYYLTTPKLIRVIRLRHIRASNVHVDDL